MDLKGGGGIGTFLVLRLNHDVIFHREITGNYILVMDIPSTNMGMVLMSSGTKTGGRWGWGPYLHFSVGHGAEEFRH